MDAVFNDKNLCATIFLHLTPKERLLGPVLVCRAWRSIIYSPPLWVDIYMILLKYMPTLATRELDGYPCGWRGYEWVKSLVYDIISWPDELWIGLGNMHIRSCLFEDGYIHSVIMHKTRGRVVFKYTSPHTDSSYHLRATLETQIKPLQSLILKGAIDYDNTSMIWGSTFSNEVFIKYISDKRNKERGCSKWML